MKKTVIARLSVVAHEKLRKLKLAMDLPYVDIASNAIVFYAENNASVRSSLGGIFPTAEPHQEFPAMTPAESAGAGPAAPATVAESAGPGAGGDPLAARLEGMAARYVGVLPALAPVILAKVLERYPAAGEADQERLLVALDDAVAEVASTRPLPKVLLKALREAMAQGMTERAPALPGLAGVAPAKAKRRPNHRTPPESAQEAFEVMTKGLGVAWTLADAETFFNYYAARGWKGLANWTFAAKAWINRSAGRGGAAGGGRPAHLGVPRRADYGTVRDDRDKIG